MRLRRGGKQRRRNLALLAMAIAIKEENVQHGTEELSAVSDQTSNIQSTNGKRKEFPLEVRKLLQTTRAEWF
jgi:hypothetical protein